MPYHQNAYWHEGGTQLLAQDCIFCGHPLRDPQSVERGCGPYCAEKHGVFRPAGPPDPEAVQRALTTMPESMRAAVEPKLADPRAAVSSAIHAAGAAWEHNSTDALWYIGSAMEITLALGYPGTARALQAKFIEGRKFNEEGQDVTSGRRRPRGIVISQAGAEWEIELPIIEPKSVWRSTMDALRAAGVRQDRSTWRIYFQPDSWLRVLNALVPTLSGTLGVLPGGEPFLVPNKPVALPEASRAPRGPATGQPGTTTDPQADAAQQAERAPQHFEKGMLVTLNDGRQLVVSWISGDQSRLGLVTPELAKQSIEKYGYIWTKRCEPIWVGTTEVQTTHATLAEKKAVEEQVEQPLARAVSTHEIPERMFPYQRESVLWLDQQGSGILALDMGLGKTAVSLIAADAPVIVVCPASLRANWAREVTLWRPDLTVAVAGIRMADEHVRSSKQSVLSPEQLAADVVILGYEGIAKNLEALRARGCRTLIDDEAHYVKELLLRWKKVDGRWEPQPAGSARAQQVWHLSQFAERRFFLTGTPMVNGRPYELWPLLHMTDPKVWSNQKNYWKSYCDYHLEQIGSRQFPVYKGATNLEELREKIHGKYLLRKTKAELDLPEKWRQGKLVSLSEDLAKDYARAAREFLTWLRESRGAKAAERAARSEIIVKLTALRRLAALGKVEAITEEILAHHASTGRPLVVFAHHKEVIAALYAACDAAGLKVGTITGDDSPQAKEEAKQHFQEGLPLHAPESERDYLDVLLCSIQAAGVGLTLTRAQDMFMCERVWRPFDMLQAEDRIHRIGQKNAVSITYYDAPGTIDEKLADVMAGKVAIAEQLLGQNDAAGAQDTDMTDAVIDSIISDAEGFVRNASGHRGAERELPNWADPE